MEIAHRGKARRMSHDANRSMKDPDGFFPELHGDQPDPLGMWMVRRSSAAAERIQAFRSSLFHREKPINVDEGRVPYAELKEQGS
jgi:hypothetical protein